MQFHQQFLLNLGLRIKAKRKGLGLTQVEFAKECRLKPSFCVVLEKGQANLSFIKLCLIARLFGQTPSELVRGIE